MKYYVIQVYNRYIIYRLRACAPVNYVLRYKIVKTLQTHSKIMQN